MKLYSYWRSTTSFRVRASLNLKNLEYEIIPVNLVAGEQTDSDYLRLNPGAGVPSLVLNDGTALVQSLAIIDYLDAIAEPKLLPEAPIERAKVLSASLIISCDIHPINNLRVVRELKKQFSASNADTKAWMQLWISKGFAALEQMLPDGNVYSFGSNLNLADLCITSQMYNAERWEVDTTPFPKIERIHAACQEHQAIYAAHPEQQPDAERTHA